VIKRLGEKEVAQEVKEVNVSGGLIDVARCMCISLVSAPLGVALMMPNPDSLGRLTTFQQNGPLCIRTGGFEFASQQVKQSAIVVVVGYRERKC